MQIFECLSCGIAIEDNDPKPDDLITCPNPKCKAEFFVVRSAVNCNKLDLEFVE